MKSIKYFAILVLFAGITAGLSSCKEKTGDLVIFVENELGEKMEGKTVYLYDSKAAFDEVEHFTSKETLSDGSVTFTELEPGIYYYDTEFTLLGVDYYPEGSSEVVSDMVTTATLKP